MRRMRGWRAVVVAVALAASTSAHAQAGSGAQTGSAGASDVAGLSADIVAVVRAERALNRLRRGAGDVLRREPQRELLGVGEDGVGVDLGEQIQTWWARNVFEPMLRLARNRAASCTVVRDLLSRVVTMQAQAQLLGIDTFGTVGDAASPLGRLFDAARRRCLEDAYDECLATGSGSPLIGALTEWARQVWIIGLDRDDWDARVTYLFRRCTVYRLQFRLELESTRPRDRETSVGTGSLTLLFRPAPGGDGATALNGGYWVAPRPHEALSSDFAFESVDCGPEARTCLPEDDLVSGSAYGRVALQRRMRTQVIRVVEPRADDYSTAAEIDRRLGGSIVVESAERVEGTDRIQMHFAAPAVHLLSVSRLHGNPTHQHHGSYLYFSALDRAFGELPALEGWTREGHPLLYSAATAANSRNGFAHLVGIYQLWHRPDLFPADEIVTEFEPGRGDDDIGPPRPPLRPPPGR